MIEWILLLVVLPSIVFRLLGKKTHVIFTVWEIRGVEEILDSLAARGLGFLGKLGVIWGTGLSGIYRMGASGREVLKDFLVLLLPLPFLLHTPLAVPVYLVFGFTGAVIAILTLSAANILFSLSAGAHASPGVGLILPGLSLGGYTIPLVEGVVGIFVALLVHEGAHGVVARKFGIAIRRAGIITAGLVVLGAFVEPDEEEFRNHPGRAEVYGAGPAANILLFLILFALMIPLNSVISPVLRDMEHRYCTGVRVGQVLEEINGHPVYAPLFFREGDVIVAIDGREVRSLSDLMEAMKGKQGKVRVRVIRGGSVLEFDARLNEEDKLGIGGLENVGELPPAYHFLTFVLSLLLWVGTINLLLGVGNYLPLSIMDGAGIIEGVWRKRPRALEALVLALLVLNALPYFI